MYLNIIPAIHEQVALLKEEKIETETVPPDQKRKALCSSSG